MAAAKESAAFKAHRHAVISAVFSAEGAGPPFSVWTSPEAFVDITLRERALLKSSGDSLCLRPVYYVADRPTSLYFDLDVSDKDLPRVPGAAAEPCAPSLEQLTDAFLAELQVFFDAGGMAVNVRHEAWIFCKPPEPGKVAKASIHVHFPNVVAASVAVWERLIVHHLRPWLYVRALAAYEANSPRGRLFIRKYD